MSENIAPGAPGTAATWTSSAKDIVGTGLGNGRVWFTVGYGILNEVYWPSNSTPQIRDLGFIIAGDDFWSEIKRVHNYSLSTPQPICCYQKLSINMNAIVWNWKLWPIRYAMPY